MKTIMTIVAIVLGVVVLACGIVAIVMAQTNSAAVADRLKQEKVSLKVFDENAPADVVVTKASQARAAADVLNEHRKGISPTHSELLGGKRFDATNPTQLTYVTGMSLEGSLNMAALAFGLPTVPL